MNRQSCILFYTNESENLISNIKKIPFDFLKVTGMSLFYVDNKPKIINFLKKNDIQNLPALYITHFNAKPDVFYDENINYWISDILNGIFPKNQINENEELTEEPTEEPTEDIAISKKSVTTIAEEIKKEREISQQTN